jgi:predicted YcjX-like family ATPase
MTTKNPVDYDELYPGRFIKSGDLRGRDVNLTIARVEVDDLEGTKGKQTKGIVHFKETKKGLVLNRTNGECIKAMFGRKIADWVGKRVTLYPAKIESEVADLAIRVRGSPDLAADVTFELHLARKRPRPMTLKKTATGKDAPAPKPEPDPVPENVAEAAEVLGGEIVGADGEVF